MPFSQPSEFGIAKILAHVAGVEVCATFILIHLFLDGADMLGMSKLWSGWRSGSGGGNGGCGGSCSGGGVRGCSFTGTSVGWIDVVSIRIFRAMTGHVALLMASETLSLLPVLDAFFVGQFLKRDGGPVNFHRHYTIVGVGVSVGIGTLIVLEVPRVTWLLIMAEVVETLVFNLLSSFDFFPSRLLPSIHINRPVFMVQNFTMDNIS